MVTFRNNNRRRNNLEEMIETLNLMEIDQNLSNFQIMKIFKEKYLVEIIIMLQIN